MSSNPFSCLTRKSCGAALALTLCLASTQAARGASLEEAAIIEKKRARILALLDSLQGVRELQRRDSAADGSSDVWRAIRADGAIETAACTYRHQSEGGVSCTAASGKGAAVAPPLPGWAEKLKDCLQKNSFDRFYAQGGMLVAELDWHLYLAFPFKDGRWHLSDPLAELQGTGTRLESVTPLGRAASPEERLIKVLLTTRPGTRWYIDEEFVVYLKARGAGISLAKLPISYSESFDKNELFSAPKGSISKRLRFELVSPQEFRIKAEAQDLKQLDRFCSARQIKDAERAAARAPDGSGSDEAAEDPDAGGHCPLDSLREVTDSIGRWKIQGAQFDRAK